MPWLTCCAQEISKANKKVVDLFRQNLVTSAKAPVPQGGQDVASVTATTQDLALLLLPYLSADDAQALFDMCITEEVLTSRDNAVQKRGYKILAKIVENKKNQIDAVSVLGDLQRFSGGLSPAAKKDRLTLLALLIEALPSDAMHVIPSLIPEAVLGAKEPSEKARGAAFDVIVQMGNKMKQGGVVKINMIDGMDDDSAGEGEVLPALSSYIFDLTPH